MRWFWRISEVLVVLALLVLIAAPALAELIYIGALYARHPVWVWLAVAFAVSVGIHAWQAIGRNELKRLHSIGRFDWLKEKR